VCNGHIDAAALEASRAAAAAVRPLRASGFAGGWDIINGIWYIPRPTHRQPEQGINHKHFETLSITTKGALKSGSRSFCVYILDFLLVLDNIVVVVDICGFFLFQRHELVQEHQLIRRAILAIEEQVHKLLYASWS
jgi:hypothetical protein